MIIIRLPFPPSTNGLFRDLGEAQRQKIATGMRRNGRHGMPPTRVMSSEYRAWRESAQRILMAGQYEQFDRPVDITLELSPADARARDVDNYAKAVLDTLVQAGVIVDDNSRHIRALSVIWRNASDDPHVSVTVAPTQHDDKPLLDADERRALRKILQAGGTYLRTYPQPMPKAVAGLIDKGYLIPSDGGLLSDAAPQAYKAANLIES